MPSDSTKSESSSSSSLLGGVKNHEPAAWHRLAKLYGPLVYGWARQAGVQENDSADIFQEVFQAVFASIRSFEPGRDAGFRRWLYGITSHKIRDHFRGKASRPDAAGGSEAQARLQQIPDIPPEDLNEESRSDSDHHLSTRALALIKTDFQKHTWQAFWRTTIDKQPAAEIADDLGMSVAAVYMAKSRVLARLREELDGLA